MSTSLYKLADTFVRVMKNNAYKHKTGNHEYLELQVDKVESFDEVSWIESVFFGDERVEPGNQNHQD